MIFYYSGTPGIKGGLPEDLLPYPVSVMTSMVEFGQTEERNRIADKRLDRIIQSREDGEKE